MKQAAESEGAAKIKPKTITVSVNEKPVRLTDNEVTGLEIKQAAVAQGVAIEVDFILVEEQAKGGTRIVGDTDVVKVTDRSRFSANAGDDNS